MSGLLIPASDPRFSYSDYQILQRNGQRVGFTRTIPNDRKYNLDSPGARMRFRCNAETIVVELLYKERIHPQRSQNSIGTWFVDGKSSEHWNFERSKRDGCGNERIAVRLPADGRMHTYELILPYGDIVELHSATVNPDAEFETPPPRPPVPTVPPRCGTAVKMCDGCVAVLARHQSALRRTRACLRPPLALPHFSLPHPPPSPAGGNRYALLYHCRQG